MSRSRNVWRIWCAPGLEELVTEEIAELTGAAPRSAHAGVTARLSDREAMVTLVWSRLAERVLVQAASFEARDVGGLSDGLTAIGWDAWCRPEVPLRLRVDVSRSALRNEGAVATEVATAIGRRSGARPVAVGEGDDTPTQLVDVSVRRNRVLVWVDATGEGLDRRRWRLATAKAPLRTTLAAAALRASRWDRRAPLLDPFCGSGTVVVEAARWAAALPPAVDRRYGIERWPSFEGGTWASAATRPSAVEPANPMIVARDRDAGAVRAARGNLERAGVDAAVTTEQGAISGASPPVRSPVGWIVSNPPWGERTREGRDPRDVWAAFGHLLADHFAGWRVAVLSPSTHLVDAMDLPHQVAFTTSSGGRRVRLHLADV
ncbi:MAG TPA: hypothetical protein VGA13_00095 [Acidimicrobiales bacterium]